MDVTVLNEVVSLPIMVIRDKIFFLKLSQLHKNMDGHFSSCRYCYDAYHNCDVFISIDRLAIILISPSSNSHIELLTKL